MFIRLISTKRLVLELVRRSNPVEHLPSGHDTVAYISVGDHVCALTIGDEMLYYMLAANARAK